MNMIDSLFLALALMLIIEGIFPFMFPAVWCETFRKISEQPTRRIRMGGLIVMVLGLLLLVSVT